MHTDFDRLKDALASRYALVRELGSGGMATVYLAEDLRHQRKVAVKVLRPDLAASLGSERFFREIQVAARLQHPHILPLLDSGEAAGLYYYVMPFVQGESLRERLDKHGELPISEAVRILREVVDALAEAHNNGVVHRDIKPDNVMLSGRHALVTDFGVAKALSEATGKQKLTTAGIALGTPAYMAPEQAVADPQLDHRVDIYAAGILAYEMLTGNTPFSGRSPQEVLAAQVTQAPEPLAKRREAVPPVLEAVIMKCLEKRPADRWQTAGALLDQLELLSTPTLGTTPTQTRPIPAVKAREFPRWVAWALGGALVAGGALALSLRQHAPSTIQLGQRTALAVAPELEMWPSLSPDGRMVAYGANFQMFVQQVGGGSPVRVTPGEFAVSPVMSPDGEKLFFGGDQGLYVMPVLGGQARLIAPGVVTSGEIMPGAWSPDGNHVVYRDRYDTLYVQSVGDTGGRRVLVAGHDLHSPAWSPDGEWIVYVEGNMGFHFIGNIAPSRILLVPAGGGTPIAITDSTALNTSPIWIPGRRALLFISDKEGGRDIYQVELKASGAPAGSPVRITTGLNPERISISADAKRLAWSVFTQTANVWEVPVTGRDSLPLSRARQVTTGTQNIEQVNVSPDGVWLYYDTDRSGNYDIWRQRLTGGAPEQLTNHPANDFAAAVSPDGRELAFHSPRNGQNNRDIFVMPAGGGPAVQVSSDQSDDRGAQWSRDGRTLYWNDLFTNDSSVMFSRRNPDGSWGPFRRVVRPGAGGFAATGSPRPDGRLTVRDSSGFHLVNPETGAGEFLTAGNLFSNAFGAWSPDGSTFYLTRTNPGQGLMIRALTYPGGSERTVAYSDNPPAQYYRFGFAFNQGKVYVPLVEPRSDVWVANLE
jgi:Tol biopolymer transport system component